METLIVFGLAASQYKKGYFSGIGSNGRYGGGLAKWKTDGCFNTARKLQRFPITTAACPVVWSGLCVRSAPTADRTRTVVLRSVGYTGCFDNSWSLPYAIVFAAKCKQPWTLVLLRTYVRRTSPVISRYYQLSDCACARRTLFSTPPPSMEIHGSIPLDWFSTGCGFTKIFIHRLVES